jgi:hypothetical protein
MCFFFFNPGPVWRVPIPNRYTAKAKLCFCKNNKRRIIIIIIIYILLPPGLPFLLARRAHRHPAVGRGPSGLFTVSIGDSCVYKELGPLGKYPLSLTLSPSPSLPLPVCLPPSLPLPLAHSYYLVVFNESDFALQRLVECSALETERVRLVALRWHSSGSEVHLGLPVVL